MTDHVVVTCTTPNRSEAVALARNLLEASLAACVQLVEIDSFYTWQDAIEANEEILLVIKTRAAHYDALEARIRELHSYEVPEIVAVPVERGLPAYLAWIDDVTG